MSFSQRPLLPQHTIETRNSAAMTAGFEPAIPTMEWPQTYTLDHMATKI